MMSLNRSKVTMVVLIVGVLLVAVGVQQAWSWRSSTDAQSQRDKAVTAASAEVKLLISVSDTNADASLKRLLDGATASFQSDLQKDAKALQQALVAEKVVATGSIVSAGIGKYSDNQATVFVAAEGTVSNTGTTAPQSREYRVKVNMEKIKGRWLVAGLVFIA